jgi:hypothetical protein
MTWIGFIFNTQGMPYDMHVYAAVAPAGSTTFGAPVEVSNTQANEQFDKPWITVTNKNSVLLTYAKTSTGGIYAARSTDHGVTWTRAVIVEDGAFRNLVYPCVPATGNRVFATYHAGQGIGLHWSDDDGVTWPAASKVAVAATGEQPAFDDPTCAAAGNEVFISYGLSPDAMGTTNSPKLTSIRIAHSPDGGPTIDYLPESMGLSSYERRAWGGYLPSAAAPEVKFPPRLFQSVPQPFRYTRSSMFPLAATAYTASSPSGVKTPAGPYSAVK